MPNKQTEKYSRYSNIKTNVLNGSNFLLYHWVSRKDATYQDYLPNARCYNWWDLKQTIPIGPLAISLGFPDIRKINPYEFKNDDLILQHLSGFLIGGWTKVKLPMFNPDATSDNILSDLLGASFMSLLDRDFATSDGYFQALGMFLSLTDETIKETKNIKTETNSRELNVQSKKLTWSK